MTSRRISFLALVVAMGAMPGGAVYAEKAAPDKSAGGAYLLKADALKRYVDDFNKNDEELYVQAVPNAAAWAFLRENIPLLDCPDKDIEQVYYFRWWTFRKHVKQTPEGFVITEFLPPVGWAGKYNTINCAAGHHLHEGRWLSDPKYLDDYSIFWFRQGGNVRSYSFWAADSLWARYLVSGDDRLIHKLLPDLIGNYEAWEKQRRDPNGLFWQQDGQDGMEVSISGSGYRATINAYMYGDALAIAKMADHFGQPAVAERFRGKAAEIKRLVQEKLWDAEAQFFKVLPQGENAKLSDARELHGYTPWYFDLPDADKSIAWKQLMDGRGFYAPFGPTTAEQRHAKFNVSYSGHECQWNGPSWPYSTSITLTAMANVLDDYRQNVVSRKDYFDTFKIYTNSHRRKREDGTVVPWIDENLHPLSGDWVARTRLRTWKNGQTWDAGKGGKERGKDYNHSTYCDLVINGLIGLRPRADDVVELSPLIPAGTWDYFCLDRVRYHGRWLTILFDRSGQRYGRGKGLRLFADGRQIAAAGALGHLTAVLPQSSKAAPHKTESAAESAETTAGWVKFAGNPVIGGKHGTCFDISVLKEGDLYRMWLSWRPKASIALVESRDGIHWSEPEIVLGPNKSTGWEDDLNRPGVLKHGGAYHMWYTGFNPTGSFLGYATSADGKQWKRMSTQPVLVADKPWEKICVMCPHVLWDEQMDLYRMWYSAGERNEPNAIGYATSRDGLDWTKHAANPIFVADPRHDWEKHKVTACQVERRGKWHYMFYIGFRDEPHAQIGIARSRDGITNWERHPANPIIRPGADKWDHDACYKPYAVFDGEKWLLWYNGRHGGLEQIGVVTHEGENLGFPASP
jgi:predicted GH43/DUF377 family glycosyl hydrolase